MDDESSFTRDYKGFLRVYQSFSRDTKDFANRMMKLQFTRMMVKPDIDDQFATVSIRGGNNRRLYLLCFQHSARL